MSMATALGMRILARYATGDASNEQLAAALTRGWITAEEHDNAVNTD